MNAEQRSFGIPGMFARLVLFVLVVFFSGVGCASYSVNPPQADVVIENPGYLVGTVTVVSGLYQSWDGTLDLENSVNFLSYTLYYRDADRFSNAKSGNIWISANVYSREFDEHFLRPIGDSFIFAVPLEPGEYVFNDYRFFMNEGVSWRAEGDFFIPFEIKAGEVTYVGDWRAFGMREEETFLGMVRVAGGFWTNIDMKDEDLERIYTKHPEVKDLPVNDFVQTRLVEDYFGYPDPLIENAK